MSSVTVISSPGAGAKPLRRTGEKTNRQDCFSIPSSGRLASMSFVEPEERVALRQAVRDLAKRYGPDYIRRQTKAGRKTTELWQEVGRAGYLGVSLPAED